MSGSLGVLVLLGSGSDSCLGSGSLGQSVLSSESSAEVDGEGLGGVSLFLQAVGGDVLTAGSVDWGGAEGQELVLLVCDARVDDEDQGLVAKDGDKQQ